MNLINPNELLDCIYSVADREEKELRNLFGHGIFNNLSERAFVYLVAKEILKREKKIFSSAKNYLYFEYPYDNGFADLVLKTNENKLIAIEFKLKDTFESYHSDIIKLNNSKLFDEKYFCALIDVFKCSWEKDGRILFMKGKFENNISAEQVSDYKFFDSIYLRYKSEIECRLGLWKII